MVYEESRPAREARLLRGSKMTLGQHQIETLSAAALGAAIALDQISREEPHDPETLNRLADELAKAAEEESLEMPETHIGRLLALTQVMSEYSKTKITTADQLSQRLSDAAAKIRSFTNRGDAADMKRLCLNLHKELLALRGHRADEWDDSWEAAETV